MFFICAKYDCCLQSGYYNDYFSIHNFSILSHLLHSVHRQFKSNRVENSDTVIYCNGVRIIGNIPGFTIRIISMIASEGMCPSPIPPATASPS